MAQGIAGTDRQSLARRLRRMANELDPQGTGTAMAGTKPAAGKGGKGGGGKKGGGGRYRGGQGQAGTNTGTGT
jgi:hypothetical protein